MSRACSTIRTVSGFLVERGTSPKTHTNSAQSLHIGAELMDCDDRNDPELVHLSTEEATACALDSGKGLTLLLDAIQKCIVRNEHRPRSSAFLAVSIDNMQSVTDLFGESVAEPVFGGLASRL